MTSAHENTPVELYGPDDGGWYTTRVYDWIALCPELKDVDVRGYLILRSLVIEKYKNPVRKLTLAVLGDLLPGVNGKENSLGRIRGVLGNLSTVGLISTPDGDPIKTSSRASAAHKPIRIRINDMPREGYAGWRNTEAKLAFLTSRGEAGKAGQNSDPHPETEGAKMEPGQNSDPAGQNSGPLGQKSDPHPGADLPESELPLDSSFGTPTGGPVPSARSAVGVRSTSTSGSSEREGGSGFAAAARESSSSDQEDGKAGVPGQRQSDVPDLSREQLAAVRAVEALVPPVLLALLPYEQFPKRNRPAVLQALESRTLEQLRKRVERRWVAYGYEPAIYDDKMTNPVGAALELIAPSRYCPDLSCEDGTMVDTGADCRACLERRAARRAARAAGQLVPSGSKGTAGGRAPECVICQAPFPGAVPDSGECLGCRKEAEAIFEALSARLGPPEVDWNVPEEEPGSGEPDDVPQDAGVDKETARLRAMYACQYGTPDQIEAYCNTAPF